MKKNEKQGFVAQKRDYSVEIKYSEEAREKKLIRFTAKRKNRSFEISLDEFINLVMIHLNKEYVPMLQTVQESVEMVEAIRTLNFKCTKDFKEGEEMSIQYIQPMPLEFAIAEEAYKMAKMQGDIVRVPLEDIQRTADDLSQRQKNYMKSQHPKMDLSTKEEISEEEQEKALDILSPYFENKEDNK